VARPKLSTAQRRGKTMTVRVRKYLDEGFAAVAFLRGSSKSGLINEYAAEQIRLEIERNEESFDAAVKEIISRKDAQRRKKAARSGLDDVASDISDWLKVTNKQHRLVGSEPGESRPNERSIGSVSPAGHAPTRIAVSGPSPLTRQTEGPFDHPESRLSDLDLTP
jgi:hypothetical protein